MGQISPVSRETRSPAKPWSGSNYFKYSYEKGRVFCFSDATKKVAGWNRFRTEGQVKISFINDESGGIQVTSREFEVLTENQNGSVNVVGLTVK